MIINKTLLLGLGLLIGVYLLYKFFFGKKEDVKKKDFNQAYNKVLTSDEYKVKGQYDK